MSSWEKLATKKIYFGHQSVGYNIIDGINDLMKEYPQIRINIIETTEPGKFNMGIFAHSTVGRNVDPKSKIDSFSENLKQGVGDKADIAFFKFCYVDIVAKTDTQDIFNAYKEAVTTLNKNYPELKIIHFTVPPTESEITWKTKLKLLIGKGEIWELGDNIKRNEYNEMLIAEYSKTGLLFDLAIFESTYPNGKRCSFSKNDKKYFTLVPEYSDDGGHLNNKGKHIIAEQFLIFLVNIFDL